MKKTLVLFIFIFFAKPAYSQTVDYQETMLKFGLELEDNNGYIKYNFYGDLTGDYIFKEKKVFGKTLQRKFNYTGFDNKGSTLMTFITSRGFMKVYVDLYFRGMYAKLTSYETGQFEQAQIIYPKITDLVYMPTKPKSYSRERKDPNEDKVVAASSGTGFFISEEGFLITNEHVIRDCIAVKSKINGKDILTDVIATDKKNDLAIIKVDLKPKQIFPISREDPKLLQDVVVAGFPLGKSLSSAIKTHKGSITSLAGYQDNYSNFQTDATINPGNSGGPIIDNKGNVVGVAVATLRGAQNVFFGIKSSTLKTFLEANSIELTPPNFRNLSNVDMGRVVSNATVYLDCYLTIGQIKKKIANKNNRKAFFSKYKNN